VDRLQLAGPAGPAAGRLHPGHRSEVTGHAGARYQIPGLPFRPLKKSGMGKTVGVSGGRR
jgi:hypothetical protein